MCMTNLSSQDSLTGQVKVLQQFLTYSYCINEMLYQLLVGRDKPLSGIKLANNITTFQLLH